ncbi:hypothetical protein H2200_004291 [Cladophialophora chaetospira]|uniref:Uncharacterized protein n=1 Tax=Cladophialophora chaetospira TaxID=386627 RepID=A0AA38XCV3_9EURO|nr:hypothetical protein H2200_004291 [Cladophialophora chaetospira]
MVTLRNGKQSYDVAGRADGALKQTRVQSSIPADKENLDPESHIAEEARMDVEDSAADQVCNSHATTPIVKLDAPLDKKRRRPGDQSCEEDNASTTTQEQDRLRHEDHDRPSKHHDAKKKPLERNRKALEIEWDRSQLRDPRLSPERVLLPRRIEFDLTEEEKQFFKGSPAKRPKKKGRLNTVDEDKIFRKEAKKNVAHCFHELYICYEKGPKASPTYDSSGFELDYWKVAEWMSPKPYNKRAMVNGMEKRLKRDSDERSKMAAAFFQGGSAPEGGDGHYAFDLLKDKVSKDLGIAWHKITAAHVEEWARMGLPKEDPCNYVTSTVSKEEKRRFLSLLKGGSLRK